MRLFAFIILFISGGFAGQALGATEKLSTPKTAEMKQAQKMVEEVDRKLPKLRAVAGKVSEVQSIDIEGSKEKHRVLLLKPNKVDFDIVVDMGAAARSDLLKIKKGKDLAVQGYYMNYEGKGLMMAQKVRYEGKIIDLKK